MAAPFDFVELDLDPHRGFAASVTASISVLSPFASFRSSSAFVGITVVFVAARDSFAFPISLARARYGLESALNCPYKSS